MSSIVRAATSINKQKVLEIFEEFNQFITTTGSSSNILPLNIFQKNSDNLYQKIVSSDHSKIFIALVDKDIVGFLEIHAVPRLRKANFYAEIESMYVKETHRGTGIASDLMKSAIEWASKQKFDCIRLYTGHELKRAHSFYEKMGFIHAGRTYKYNLL